MVFPLGKLRHFDINSISQDAVYLHFVGFGQRRAVEAH